MDSPEISLPLPDLARGSEASLTPPIESQVDGGDPSVSQATAAGAMALRPYDFRRPALLSSNESRKLHAQYEDFLRRLATRLTNYLRLDVGLTLRSFETVPFQKFTEALPVPTHLTLFKVEPLRGICVIELSSVLGLAFFDRLMGGTGQCATSGRELTEIEAALIDHVVQFILEDWCATCAKPQDCQPVLLGHETDSRYLQTSPPDSTVFVISAAVSLAEVSGQIQIAFPLSTLEPSIRSLRQDLKGVVESPADLVSPRSVRWNKALEDMNISVTAELPPLQTPARAVARLRVGDIVPLPPEFANRVQMRLEGMLRFTGRLGTRDGRWAIEVTNISKSRSSV
ncbi:MAG: FliM/FliN family flagellar motor switch protein [Verrucomicrobiales bacterium]|nr:FliM/FliN family flagellar motor switch protein [Verrucomicrobiales bacterium]